MNSMASRAWSVDSDAIPGLTESSDKLVTDLSRSMSDMIVTATPEAIEGGETPIEILPMTAKIFEGRQHQNPSVEDTVDDAFLQPILPPDSKFVLETMKPPGSRLEPESLDLDISRAHSRAHRRQVSHRTSRSRSSLGEDSSWLRAPRLDFQKNEASPPRIQITNPLLYDMDDQWSEEVCLLPVAKNQPSLTEQ